MTQKLPLHALEAQAVAKNVWLNFMTMHLGKTQEDKMVVIADRSWED
jgi:hypothetical protein